MLKKKKKKKKRKKKLILQGKNIGNKCKGFYIFEVLWVKTTLIFGA
jgi:hypothetical protein